MIGRSLIVLATVATLVGCREARLRSGFIDGCTSSGTSEKVCECTWKGMAEHYGVDRIQKMQDANILAPDFVEIGARVKAECLMEVSGMSANELFGSPAPVDKAAVNPGAVAANEPDAKAMQASGPAVKDAEVRDVSGQSHATGEVGSQAEADTSTRLSVGGHNLTIHEDAGDYVVSLDAREIKRVQATSVSSKWMSSGGDAVSYALLEINAGGIACPASYIIVEVQQDGATRVSPEFGSCSDQITATTTFPGGMSVAMPGYSGPQEPPQVQAKAAGATRTYVWKGGALIEQ